MRILINPLMNVAAFSQNKPISDKTVHLVQAQHKNSQYILKQQQQ